MIDFFRFAGIADACPHLVALLHKVVNNPGANVATGTRDGDGAVGRRYSGTA
jgi:hypothetical protein